MGAVLGDCVARLVGASVGVAVGDDVCDLVGAEVCRSQCLSRCDRDKSQLPHTLTNDKICVTTMFKVLPC